LDNQSEIFLKKNETIVKWGALKELIASDISLTNRYKTFDGNLWDQVKELNNDTLFIHVNISASQCMIKMAKVMEKLFLPDDSIQIKLK